MADRSSSAATLVAAALLGGLVGLAACSTTGRAPSPVAPSPSASESTPRASSPAASRPTASPSPVAAASATPLPDVADPPTVPLATVTLICESWGSDPPASTIPCRDAASRALAVLGPGPAPGVDRLEVGFGDDCQGRTSCASRRPDRVWVIVSFGRPDARLVRVARTASGDLEVWPPTMTSFPPAPPFDPPARVAPDLGPDAPAGLRDREAYPYCGGEDLGPSEEFDAPARRCFVDGLLAGSPVELISRSPSTEGELVLTLYRFGGSGSVVRSVHAGGRWTTAVCGISPIATDAAFTIGGGCDAIEP